MRMLSCDYFIFVIFRKWAGIDRTVWTVRDKKLTIHILFRAQPEKIGTCNRFHFFHFITFQLFHKIEQFLRLTWYLIRLYFFEFVAYSVKLCVYIPFFFHKLYHLQQLTNLFQFHSKFFHVNNVNILIWINLFWFIITLIILGSTG